MLRCGGSSHHFAAPAHASILPKLRIPRGYREWRLKAGTLVNARKRNGGGHKATDCTAGSVDDADYESSHHSTVRGWIRSREPSDTRAAIGDRQSHIRLCVPRLRQVRLCRSVFDQSLGNLGRSYRTRAHSRTAHADRPWTSRSAVDQAPPLAILSAVVIFCNNALYFMRSLAPSPFLTMLMCRLYSL
jgi:hypothetical protein